MTQPDSLRADLEQQMNEVLASVDHSAKSISKYRAFEELSSSVMDIPSSEVYTAFISKAGNVTVRFDQSLRARDAAVLVALVDPPDDEPVSRTIEALRRYLLGKREKLDTEALVLIRRDSEWRPSAIMIPSYKADRSRTLLQPIANIWLDIEVFGYLRESDPSQEPNAGHKFLTMTESDVQDSPWLAEPSFPHLELQRDSWDDFGFQTTFWAILHLGPTQFVELGELKILVRGQQGGPTGLPRGSFRRLPARYCSLGQAYSYYERLRELPEHLYRAILRGLRDVVFDERIRGDFQNQPGFKESLSRNGAAVRALEDGPALFGRKILQHFDRHGVRFAFQTNVGGSPFDIDFRFDESPRIPDRINAVIGYNGSGKTQLLANLAVVASGDHSRRQILAESAGMLDHSEDLRFGAVIAISYSAFDTFDLPGSFVRSAEQAAALSRLERQGELNGYVYCGLRTRAPEQELDTRSPRGLKSINEVSGDFRRALSLAQSSERQAVFRQALSIIRAEPSFGRIGLEANTDGASDEDLGRLFEELSTGHKIVLNMIVQVVAHSEQRSLILIDEPESHLHPSLLAALLRALNFLLQRFNSYCVVATHSPVVLQEIPRRYVRVLQRFGSRTAASEPLSETFGENVGYLTANVFDLDSTQTDYHAVLEDLARDMSLEQIEELFDDELSGQARAFVISLKKSGDRRRGMLS